MQSDEPDSGFTDLNTKRTLRMKLIGMTCLPNCVVHTCLYH